jgi:hypothetical protein
MKIRFLEIVESDHPERPFRPGQVIDVDHPTPAMRAWIKTKRAELVREDDSLEVAAVTVPEHAVTRRGKRSAPEA